jgi:predicted transcriptional regulator of viral defense system
MEKRMTNPKSEGYISAKDMAGRAAYYKVLQAAKNGELTRIKRGVYATDDHLASQMLDVEKVVPGGVLCLYSAWSHYQLTTQVPHNISFGICRKRILEKAIFRRDGGASILKRGCDGFLQCVQVNISCF